MGPIESSSLESVGLLQNASNNAVDANANTDGQPKKAVFDSSTRSDSISSPTPFTFTQALASASGRPASTATRSDTGNVSTSTDPKTRDARSMREPKSSKHLI